MHLIIGSRGAGKSLFIYRFFTHLMPQDLKARAVWCIIDFNRAPSSIDNIEDYICDKFLENAENLQFDPHSLDGLNRVFAVEINRLNKGPLAAISDEHERQRMLSTELLKLSNDKRAFAVRLGRHITGNADRPLIIAFDNVDRRESAQQLHIFQAAQWFRSETRAFALLTLRDVTFERFKGEPPLDAFAQISNFYIRPPRFALVLQKRLKLAIDVGLIRHKMLAYDGEDTERPSDTDLIKITPSGFIHLRSLPQFIEYLSSAALHAPFADEAVSRRIADTWERTTRYVDLDFSHKHDVSSMFADFLVREKTRLDAQNPLFKERSREAESLIRAATSVVNTTEPIAASIKARNLAAAKQRRAQQPPPPPRKRGRRGGRNRH